MTACARASDARALEKSGGKIVYAGEADITDEQIAALSFEMYRHVCTRRAIPEILPHCVFCPESANI